MKVRILSFAACREITGSREIELDVDEEATVSCAMKELIALYPALGSLRESLVVAVNAEYVEPTKVLKAGDEMALIPPVSGG